MEENLKIRVAGFVPDSIVDGPGIRFALFCQGCAHACPGCHNPQTHDFSGGTEHSVSEIVALVRKNPLCKGVTFTGGDPMYQPQAFLALARELRSLGYELACYTGFTWEELMAEEGAEADFRRAFLAELDVLVDGRFVLAQRNMELLFRGSGNQRIIDVQESLRQSRPVLCRQSRWTGVP